ncbi:MAG: hypothetical protein HKN68_15715 [Saprospiraceae bacterium]|nr:hypothetical protein [Saprospiraceae bacterium]
MNWKAIAMFLFIAIVVMNCGKTRELTLENSRTINPDEVSAIHPNVAISVGWMPYQSNKLIQTGDYEWKIVKNDNEDSGGLSPVIMITYQDEPDTLFLDMNIDNELLGKLLKHSVMTQQKISRPFTTFFEEAKCASCHPKHIKIDFGE